MTETEYLLVYLASEAVEVAHRATKALHFGLDEKQPGQDKNNEQRLRSELYDLYAIVAELERRGILKRDGEAMLAAMMNKGEAMKKFMGYSRDLGRLT